MVWGLKSFIRILKSTKRLGVKVLNNNDKINKSIIENLLVILIMSLYIVYGMYFVPLLIIFIPLPFVIHGIRNGIKNNIISMAMTALIVGIILDMPSAVILLLMFAPLSIALNYCIKNRKKTSEIILISTGSFFISLLIIVAIFNNPTDLNGAQGYEELITEMVTIQTDKLKEMGVTNTQILKDLELLEYAYEYMLITLPSILVIISAFVSCFNYLLITLVSRRMGYGIAGSPKFSKFKLPDNIIMGSGIMFISAIAMGWLNIPYHNALLLNISLLVGFIFLIQGLAVIDFLLIKAKIRLFFRMILLFMNVIFVPMSGVLFFIGMFDSVFDMRKIGRRKSL